MKKNVARLVCLFLTLVLTACLCLPGCAPADPGRDAGKNGVRIVCTTFPAFDFCRTLSENLGNTDCPVTGTILSSNGQDLHNFQPSAADIAEISRADILVCVGGTGEPWLESAVSAAGNQNLTVISMMEICTPMEEIIPEGAEPEEHDDDTEVEYDEHIWTSFGNAEIIVRAIADAVTARMNERGYTEPAAVVENNRDRLLGQLDDLKARFAETVSTAARREVVIADRYPFAYLFKELGLSAYAAFPGCSAETQASFETQVFLIEKTKSLGLPAVFTVDNGAGSVAETVSRETGAQVLRLWSGQTIPDGDMRYLDMLEENLRNLRTALN